MRELADRYEEQAVVLKGAKEDNAAAAAQSALRVAGASSWTWARAAAGRRAERGASPSAGSAAPSVRSQETKDTATTFSALTEDSHDERRLCGLPTSLGSVERFGELLRLNERAPGEEARDDAVSVERERYRRLLEGTGAAGGSRPRDGGTAG